MVMPRVLLWSYGSAKGAVIVLFRMVMSGVVYGLTIGYSGLYLGWQCQGLCYGLPIGHSDLYVGW